MPVPFCGELMTCVLCGTQEKSSPQVQSQWRAVLIQAPVGAKPLTLYACPAEFPPDGGPSEDFKRAYFRFVMACVEKLKRHSRG